MSKTGTEYYNLEKVSEVLSVSAAEVNRLREQNKLRGFRDGSTWKFNKEEIHAYLAESIKARGSGAGEQADDGDFDLAEDDDSVSFDLLEEALPDEDQLISAASTPPKSDLDLAALDLDDELALAEETQVSSLVMPTKPTTPVQLQKEPEIEPEDELFEVELEEDSSALVLASPEEDSVLSAAGFSPQFGLASDDDGFDILVAEENEVESDILLDDEEKTEPVLPSAAEDFVLEPAPKEAGDDDSESSSQVIAIDVGFMEEVSQDTDPFGGDAFEGFSDFDTGIPAPPTAASAPSAPFGSPAPPADFDFAVTRAPDKKSAVQEAEYSKGTLIALVSALVVMLLSGVFMLDTVMHMWSWEQPFPLSSYLMGTIAGIFGL